MGELYLMNKFINNRIMSNYTIELPDGFVIDTEKSTDTKIVVKAIVEQEQKTECKTYEEIQAHNKWKHTPSGD